MRPADYKINFLLRKYEPVNLMMISFDGFSSTPKLVHLLCLVPYNDAPESPLNRRLNLRDLLVTFAYGPWFHSGYILDDNIIMPYVRGNYLSDIIPFLA